jgi:hypothetical protein
MRPFLVLITRYPDRLDYSRLTGLPGGILEDREEDFGGRRGGRPGDL